MRQVAIPEDARPTMFCSLEDVIEDSHCQHMSTRWVEVQCLFQSSSSESAQLRYRKMCTVFSFFARVMNGGIELSRPSLFLPLARPWQAEQIL